MQIEQLRTGLHTHIKIHIDIHTANITGLLGGVRGDLTFVLERDVLDARFVRERERGLRTGLLREPRHK